MAIDKISDELGMRALAAIPFSIGVGNQNIVLNTTKPVSTNPEVAGSKRNNKYPIIFVPGVMVSRFIKKFFPLSQI